jgi:hypothetical protein
MNWLMDSFSQVIFINLIDCFNIRRGFQMFEDLEICLHFSDLLDMPFSTCTAQPVVKLVAHALRVSYLRWKRLASVQSSSSCRKPRLERLDCDKRSNPEAKRTAAQDNIF